MVHMMVQYENNEDGKILFECMFASICLCVLHDGGKMWESFPYLLLEVSEKVAPLFEDQFGAIIVDEPHIHLESIGDPKLYRVSDMIMRAVSADLLFPEAVQF